MFNDRIRIQYIYFFCRAIASFCIYPIIQAVGVGYAFTIASLLLAVTGNLLIILLLIYGSKWRESCDKKEAVSNKEKS